MQTLTITVRHARDESCNDYTITRRIEVQFPLTDGPVSSEFMQRELRTSIDVWKATYPHRGRTAHTPVVDVEIMGAPQPPQHDAVNLLRQAMSSGQLHDTLIGEDINRWLANYDMIKTA